MGIIVVRSDQTNIDRIYLNDEFSSAQFSHKELTAVVQFVHRRCSSVIAKTRKRGRSFVNQLPAYIYLETRRKMASSKAVEVKSATALLAACYLLLCRRSSLLLIIARIGN